MSEPYARIDALHGCKPWLEARNRAAQAKCRGDKGLKCRARLRSGSGLRWEWEVRGWDYGDSRGEAEAKCWGGKAGEQGSSGAHGGRFERSVNENEGVLMVLG